jgi:glutaredoxin
MITVYGADWCEDTRRSLRHLRRLGVPHRYQNVDEDLDALHRATSLNGGVRRTPTIDLGLGGGPLVEPNNDTLTGALVEVEMLSQDQADERLGVQNVDVERVGRTGWPRHAGRRRRGARALRGRCDFSVLEWP